MPAKNKEKAKIGRPAQSIARNTIGGRIRAARDMAKLSAVTLAGRIGIRHQSLTAIERNEVEAEKRTLILLAQELKSDFGLSWLKPHATEGETTEIRIEGRIAAGKPIEFLEGDETIQVDPGFIKTSGEVTALRVAGESMVENHILSGDILICRKAPEPRKGMIVVVDLKGERGATVKRWERKGGMIYLYSERNAKPGDKQEFHDWEVGKVFEILGLVRRVT